jgi:hypothetical protein
VPRLLYALSIFVVLGVSAQAIPRESVRTELAQLEKQKGLRLTSYYDGLQVVSFKNHRKYHGKKLVPMEGGASAISPDGTEIALELVSWKKNAGSLWPSFDGTVMTLENIRGLWPWTLAGLTTNPSWR